MAEMMETPSQPTQLATSLGFRARYRWLPYLTLILMLQLVLLLHLVPGDPALVAWFEQLGNPYRRAQHARRLAALMRNDPALGEKVLSKMASPVIAGLQGADERAERLLLFIGPCTPCVSKDLLQWAELAAKHRRAVVVISRDAKAEIANYGRAQRLPIPMIADPDGTLSSAFNAAWVPRAYVVSREGRVTWIQTDDSLTPKAIASQVWGNRRD